MTYLMRSTPIRLACIFMLSLSEIWVVTSLHLLSHHGQWVPLICLVMSLRSIFINFASNQILYQVVQICTLIYAASESHCNWLLRIDSSMNLFLLPTADCLLPNSFAISCGCHCGLAHVHKCHGFCFLLFLIQMHPGVTCLSLLWNPRRVLS
jgi:hypothetical protein